MCRLSAQLREWRRLDEMAENSASALFGYDRAAKRDGRKTTGDRRKETALDPEDLKAR
ncbi:MAG: hypothetical protein H6Q33_3837 [Deltaproteobacteria bacterium]|nr:hypothetical protein [Deltaproteobacteria bacterium]